MPKKAFVALAVTLVATAQAVVSADAAAPPAIAAAARGAARSESGTSPASLVSRPWTRNVIAADWTRQHFPAGPVGVWKLVFRPDGVVDSRLIDVAYGDLGPFGCKLEGRRPPDSLACTRNDGNLVRQAHAIPSSEEPVVGPRPAIMGRTGRI